MAVRKVFEILPLVCGIFICQLSTAFTTTQPFMLDSYVRCYSRSSFKFIDAKDYAKCHLARVSPNGILARRDANFTAYRAVLKNADKQLGRSSSNPLYLYDDVLFSDKAVGLEEVAAVNQTYMKYLDADYASDVAAFDSCKKAVAGASLPQYKLFVAVLMLIVYQLFA
eukprot:Seg8910.1 transcript_id=Seg8910.1/GoldUCD/mRNA.D3Y31 product="hypothetical protein" protein_id=Seg8910.1/GoldUCD/D3Y31